jgi:hypothetical protein
LVVRLWREYCISSRSRTTGSERWVGFVFTAVGALVAYRRPRELMGWLMLAVGGFWALAVTGGEYATLAYPAHGGRLPFGWLAVLMMPLWVAAFVSLAVAVVLFPDGKLPSARWRWPLRLLLGLFGAWVISAALALIPLVIAGTVRITADQNIAQLNHPMHATVASKAYGITLVFLGLSCVLVITAWLLSQLFSYRRLTGERRAQQKWILAGVSTSFFAITASFALGNNSSTIANLLALGIVAMPLAMGVGILKYRLYEIDRIVSRTLSYAILTAVLAGTFVCLVLLSTRVLPFSSAVGVAASTLAAAALFNPLRVRVQRAVDRRFNRTRYDAEVTVAAFAARLRDAVDLDAIQADLIEAVRGAVQPAHTTIWMRREESP